MKALHPELIRWLEDQDNEQLVMRLIRAEKAVGQFGKIELIYHQGKVETVTAQATHRL